MKCMPRESRLTTGMILALAGLALCVGCAQPGADVWAIKCISVDGPDQHTIANYYAESLRHVEALDADLVRVIFDEDFGNVYYGSYTLQHSPFSDQPTYHPDPAEDLELIKSLSADQVTRPFGAAHLMPVPADAVGNPAWDASRAEGYWSLQVGVFYNTETMQRRRQAAVDYCRLLRAKGEDAYYYHGPSMSSVLIGTFPRKAMMSIQRRQGTLEGKPKHVAEYRIIDRRLRALQAKYPHNLENLHVVSDLQLDTRTGKKERFPRPSVVVKLPSVQRAERNAASGGPR